MNRWVLLVIPLFLWLASTPLSLAPTLEAATYKCILPNSCAPPPCEFFTELKLAKATVRALASAKAPLSRSKASFRQYANGLNSALRKAHQKFSKCLAYDPPPRFTVSVAPACNIGVSVGDGNMVSQTLEEGLATTRGCSESVEAEYAGAKVLQALCPSLKPPLTVAVDRATTLLEEQRTVDSLEQSLLQYLSSCAPDEKTSRAITKAGLSSLLKAGRKARLNWIGDRTGQAAGSAGGGLAR